MADASKVGPDHITRSRRERPPLEGRRRPLRMTYPMALDQAIVARAAKLARIKLTPQEQETLAGELGAILAFVEQLSEVPTEGVEPMTSVAQLTLPLRRDMVSDGDRRDDILRNAPAATFDFFTVPKVVE